MTETMDLFTAQHCLMNQWVSKLQLKECLKLLPYKPNRRLDEILYDQHYLSIEQITALRELWQKENPVTLLSCPVCLEKHEIRGYKEDQLYFCSRCGHILPPHIAPIKQNSKNSQEKVQSPSIQPNLIPSQFGPYQILAEIGRGGMGVVYKVIHPDLEFPLALKVLLPSQDEVNHEENVMRFFREIELASQLRHPNIVSIHEVGSYNGCPYFTMDYVEGQTLDNILDAEQLIPEKEALEIMEKIALGLACAHRAQIIHRDIKPANIIMDKQRRPFLMDFGIATCRDQIFKKLTRTGTIMGTPEYMSPEQASGNIHAIGFSSDVYSLGATLYHMLTGRPPYDGNTAMDTINKVVEGNLVPLRDVAPNISRQVEAVVMKAMSFYIEDRYPNAGIFALELHALLTGGKTIAQPPAPWHPHITFIRKNWLTIVCFFIAGLSVIFAMIFIMLALSK